MQADYDAMIAQMADGIIGGTVVDRQELRTQVTARFGDAEADYTQKIEVVASNLGSLVSFTETFKATYDHTTSTFTTQITTISSSLGALSTRTDSVEAKVDNPTTGVLATASGLAALSGTVTGQGALITANASAIIAVEASIDNVLAGGNIAIQAVAAPSGWAVRASFAIWGGSTFLPVGLYMDAKSDGTRRIVLDADSVVYTGTQRSVNGLSYWDMDAGDIVSTGFFSFG